MKVRTIVLKNGETSAIAPLAKGIIDVYHSLDVEQSHPKEWEPKVSVGVIGDEMIVVIFTGLMLETEMGFGSRNHEEALQEGCIAAEWSFAQLQERGGADIHYNGPLVPVEVSGFSMTLGTGIPPRLLESVVTAVTGAFEAERKTEAS